MRTVLKALRLLVGYSVMGLGLLTLLIVAKLLMDVFPEVLGVILFGTFLTTFGFWILNKKTEF